MGGEHRALLQPGLDPGPELLAGGPAHDDADVAALKGWRRELFGSQALELKRGDIALGFESKKIQVIELE